MEQDEVYYIERYKDYAEKHLPEVETLAGLWAPDFDETAYPDLDFTSAVRAYLDDLRPYCKVLSKAARLRQEHYELFIENKKTEDDGHRAWREGMNFMAEDCSEKFDYWTNIHDKSLLEVINRHEIEQAKEAKRKLKLDISSQNPDLQKTNKVRAKPFNPKSVVQRPPLSRAERERRKREHEAWVKARRETEDKILMEAIDETNEVLMGLNRRVVGVSPTEYLELLRSFGFADFLNTKFNNVEHYDIFPNSLGFKTPIMGSDAEMKALFDYILIDVYKLTVNDDLIEQIDSSEDLSVLYTRYRIYLQQICNGTLEFKVYGLKYVYNWLSKGIGQKLMKLKRESNNTGLWELVADLSFELPSEVIWKLFGPNARKKYVDKYMIYIYVNGFYSIADRNIEYEILIGDVATANKFYTQFKSTYFQDFEFDPRMLKLIDRRIFRNLWLDTIRKFKKTFNI